MNMVEWTSEVKDVIVTSPSGVMDAMLIGYSLPSKMMVWASTLRSGASAAIAVGEMFLARGDA